MTQLRQDTEIEEWLAAYLADLLGVPRKELDRDADFDSFGLDSAAAVAMIAELEERLGREIDPSAAYDYTTVRELARHLATLDRASS